MLSVSDLTIYAKILQCCQKPTESQGMKKFRYYTVTRYVRTFSEVCKFKQRAVFGTIFLSFFESIDPKKHTSFKSIHIKYP